MKILSNKKWPALLALALTGFQLAYSQTPVPYGGVVGKTLNDSKEWWPEPKKAPAGAPNVLWIILDDVGFGATGTFGGVINTPNFDTLANGGLRYTNFHTAGICAPTRSALLTGRNHHYVHEGGFSHVTMSAGFPGYDGRIPADKGTIAEILRENGYNTFAVGKYGLTPDEDATDAGPFDRWPTGKGFDHFFGFLGSATDQYKPDLVEDNAHVTPDGRHLNEQITDKAIFYLSRQHKVAPDKPFFLYYSPGATHSPHQVAKQWSDLYKGKFDGGWDKFREDVIANEKKLGIIPQNAQLPARNPRIPAWNSLPPQERKLYARFMEVYAGYLTYTDHEVGRLINYLKTSGQLDNILVFVILGDNGASKEGTVHGVINSKKNAPRLTKEDAYLKTNLEDIDDIGTPQASTNYPLGWAQAANTPFKFWKQDANSEGGTRNPLIVYYPKGIKQQGIRTQYGHVIDVLPTTLEYLGIKLPDYIRGIKQDTLQGTSLAYSFDNAKAPSKHTLQHYYIFGSRSIYKDGWKAEAAHHPDNVELGDFKVGQTIPDQSFDDDVWELYNLNEDFNERIDLAKKYPEKLKELKAVFDEQAKKNNLYPFIDWYDVYHLRIHQNYKK
ncbi:arylsulfatase [Mucilaginibacter paludis]|uniref:Sulfatase n=1 Tax=Mucilaginibacter paludis DSM 18603 TaxID=714943 RepID=H1YA04_9SPHI|nr:arylsulfatase [Mucilaginibacter paludis]EHQ24988.1 sulfatase [Mucilaginibacter paludis DSM 18603]